MLPSRRPDPDMPKLALDQAWRKGRISDSTYLRSMVFADYLPHEAVTELDLLKRESK